MSVIIVTDSNCGLTNQMAEEMGVEIQPTPVLINGEQYFEEENLTKEQFYEFLKNDETTVSTSQPNPYNVAERWDRLLQSYDEILYMPLSSGLSETALVIKHMAETDPKYIGKVYALDNHRVSITQRQAVEDALKMIKEGKKAKEIYDYLMETSAYSSIYIAVNTLKYLKKGGRLTPAAAAIGTLLKIKPVLQIQGKVLDKYAQARKMSDAKALMVEALRKDLNGRFKELCDQGKMTICVAHTDCLEEALKFKEQLIQEFPNVEITYVDPLSLSVAVHIGPGALACATVIKY
jgi:DegV family protein with EDD domain